MAIRRYAEHVNVNMIPFFLGTVTADTVKKMAFTSPWGFQLLGAQTFARAVTGTDPVLTLDVLEDGVSKLSAPCAVVADTVSEASIGADDTIAAGGAITINADIGGTDNPAFADVTVTLFVRRTN